MGNPGRDRLTTEIQDTLREDTRQKVASIYRAPVGRSFKGPRKEGPKSLCPVCNRFYSTKVIKRHIKACKLEADPIGEFERSLKEAAEGFWNLPEVRHDVKAVRALERWEAANKSLIKNLRKLERGE